MKIMTTRKAMILTFHVVLFTASLCTCQEQSSGILEGSLAGNTDLLEINSKFLDTKYLRGTISNFKRNDMSSTIIDEQTRLPDEYSSTLASSSIKPSLTFDTSLVSTYTVTNMMTSLSMEDTSESVSSRTEDSSLLQPTPQLPHISLSEIHSSSFYVIEPSSPSSVLKMHSTSLSSQIESSKVGADITSYSSSYAISDQDVQSLESEEVSSEVSVQEFLSPSLGSFGVEYRSLASADNVSIAITINPQLSMISESSKVQIDNTLTFSHQSFVSSEFPRMESSATTERYTNNLTGYSSHISAIDDTYNISTFDTSVTTTGSSLHPSLTYISETVSSPHVLSDSLTLSSLERELTSNTTTLNTESFHEKSMPGLSSVISTFSSADPVSDSEYNTDKLVYSDVTEMISPTSVLDLLKGLTSVTPPFEESLLADARESSEIFLTTIVQSDIPSLSSTVTDHFDTEAVIANTTEADLSRDTMTPGQVTPQMTLHSSSVYLSVDESNSSTLRTIGDLGYSSSSTGSDTAYSTTDATSAGDSEYGASTTTVIEKHNATMATTMTRFDNGSTTRMVPFTEDYDTGTSKATTATTTQIIAVPQTFNVTYEIVFKGECAALVKKKKIVLGEFWLGLRDTLTKNLSINKNQMKPHDIVCNPIRIVFSIFNIHSVENTTAKLYRVVNSGSFVIKVLIPEEDRTTYYVAVKLNTDPTFDENNVKDDYNVGLTQIDIIVIISVCIFSMILVCLGFVVCAREYYVKKRTRSFDLSEIVNINSQFDDYSLTKCPRPKVTYSENGMKMHSLGKKTGKHEKEAIEKDICETETLVNDIQLRLNSNESGLMVSVMGISPSDNTESRSDGRSREETDQSEALLVKQGDSPLHSIDNPIYFADDERFAPV